MEHPNQRKPNPTQGARADATPGSASILASNVWSRTLTLSWMFSCLRELASSCSRLISSTVRFRFTSPMSPPTWNKNNSFFQMPEADYISAIWRNGEWMKLCNALHMISSFADVNNHQVIIIQQIIVTQPDLKQHEYGLPRLCPREKVTDRLSGKWRMPRCWSRWDGGLSVNLSVRQAECTRWMLSLSFLLSDSNCLVRSLLILSGGSNHL